MTSIELLGGQYGATQSRGDTTLHGLLGSPFYCMEPFELLREVSLVRA